MNMYSDTNVRGKSKWLDEFCSIVLLYWEPEIMIIVVVAFQIAIIVSILSRAGARDKTITSEGTSSGGSSFPLILY